MSIRDQSPDLYRIARENGHIIEVGDILMCMCASCYRVKVTVMVMSTTCGKAPKCKKDKPEITFRVGPKNEDISIRKPRLPLIFMSRNY